MKLQRSVYSRVLACTLALVIPLLPGCVALPVSENPPILNLSPPSWEFPPQKVMREGNYEAFLTANEKSVEECSEYDACAVALFNLGFLHAYSVSPYLNFTKALRYFERLNKDYPESPWAFQAKAWLDILKRNIVLERNQRQMQESQQRMHNELKSKVSAVTDLHEEISDTQDRMKESQDGLSEVEEKERKLLETISELQEQLRRSQEIDVKIEQKERELLQ
jgi:hypothetical protein